MNPPVSVNTVLELKDIRPPVGVPGEWLWLWILAGCLCVVVIYFLFRHFWHQQKKVPEVVIIPSWEKALAALLSLEQRPYIKEGNVKIYYAELSGIVRQYIEERFLVRAPEMTTEEFMDVLRHSDKLIQSHQKFLEDFLNASDMVKFAKFVPSESDMHEGLNLARRFVEATR